MSSKRSMMSLRPIPRIAAFNMMFSRPERSGWNPAPSSSRAPIRRETRTLPEFGCKIPAMHFSRVLLPEPFWPITPNTSPSRTSNVTSLTAMNSSNLLRPRAAMSCFRVFARS